MDAQQLTTMARAFPFVSSLSAPAVALLSQTAVMASFGPGMAIARPGDPCEKIAFLLDGEVRVHKTSRAGRDLTLYRMFPGQTCILTATSILAGQAFPAHADVERETSAAIVPRTTFERLVVSEPAWQAFVFTMMSQRLTDLLELIDDIVFTDLPARLAAALLTQQTRGIVPLTHEKLASETGSSREVVSRVLKTWEGEGIVALARGQLAICAPERLRALTVH